MRFAYIDSHGKEVGISSVDGLQLRIELGAIVPETMFYDARSDRWAPAAEHEIFRTLNREIREKEEGRFVAPPPPLLQPLPEPVSRSGTETEDPGSREARDEGPDAEAPSPGEEGRAAEAGIHFDPPLDELDFELTPLEEGERKAADGGPVEDAPPGNPFDFGDFGALVVEPPPEPEPPRAPGREPEPEPPRAPEAGFEIEERLADREFGGGGPAWEGELELEPPLTDYSPERPPAWMTEQPEPEAPRAPPPARADAPPPRARPHAGAAAGPGGARREPTERPRRPAPRPRPAGARPPASSRSGPTGLIATLFLLVLVAGGGWFGWAFFHGRGAEVDPARRFYAPVEIPSLPPELEPRFRELADGALQDVTARMDELRAGAALSPEPPADWLAGRYLAGASGYPELTVYFNALSAFLEELRAREETLFLEALDTRMAALDVPAEDRRLLRERAVAGFASALPERDVAYDGLADVFTAARGLHDFLLQNEDDIDHEPAIAGLSRDPVLEAVPLTRQLGDEMWARVDRITTALEAMGALSERVTTERLFSLMLQRLAATSVH